MEKKKKTVLICAICSLTALFQSAYAQNGAANNPSPEEKRKIEETKRLFQNLDTLQKESDKKKTEALNAVGIHKKPKERKPQNSSSPIPKNAAAKHQKALKKVQIPTDPYSQKLAVFKEFIGTLYKMEEQLQEKKRKAMQEEASKKETIPDIYLPVPVKAAVIGDTIFVYAKLPNISQESSGLDNKPAPVPSRENTKSKAERAANKLIPKNIPLPSLSSGENPLKYLVSQDENGYVEVFKGREFGNWIVTNVTEKYVEYKNKKTGQITRRYY